MTNVNLPVLGASQLPTGRWWVEVMPCRRLCIHEPACTSWHAFALGGDTLNATNPCWADREAVIEQCRCRHGVTVLSRRCGAAISSRLVSFDTARSYRRVTRSPRWRRHQHLPASQAAA